MRITDERRNSKDIIRKAEKRGKTKFWGHTIKDFKWTNSCCKDRGEQLFIGAKCVKKKGRL